VTVVVVLVAESLLSLELVMSAVEEEAVSVLSLDELAMSVVVVMTTVTCEDVLDEEEYLLLRQLHAELIRVLVPSSLHAVVAENDADTLAANDEQKLSPGSRSSSLSNTRRQLFALHPGPYSPNMGGEVVVEVRNVVWFAKVDVSVIVVASSEVLRAIDESLVLLANGGTEVLLAMEVELLEVLLSVKLGSINVSVPLLSCVDVELSDKVATEVLEELVVGKLEVVVLLKPVDLESVVVTLADVVNVGKVDDEVLVGRIVAVVLKKPEDVALKVGVEDEALLVKLDDRLELRLVDKLDDRLLKILLERLE
jgi:hypothetical protein